MGNPIWLLWDIQFHARRIFHTPVIYGCAYSVLVSFCISFSYLLYFKIEIFYLNFLAKTEICFNKLYKFGNKDIFILCYIFMKNAKYKEIWKWIDMCVKRSETIISFKMKISCVYDKNEYWKIVKYRKILFENKIKRGLSIFRFMRLSWTQMYNNIAKQHSTDVIMYKFTLYNPNLYNIFCISFSFFCKYIIWNLRYGYREYRVPFVFISSIKAFPAKFYALRIFHSFVIFNFLDGHINISVLIYDIFMSICNN